MIYYVFKDAQKDYTCKSSGSDLISTFEKNGCIALTESNFLNSNFNPSDEDVVVVYISVESQKSLEKLKSLNCVKVLHSIDESKSDAILYRTQLKFLEDVGSNTIINAYPSKRNLDFLSSKGLEVITLPLCGSKRMVDISNKDIDVLVSGQMDASYYPTRTKILSALSKSDVKFAYLPHSGMEASKATHQYHGEKFLELLDRCWLGVTCKAGNFRDRLVAKYVEFGFSKVLPVGDVPTYMDKRMSESMLSIEESDSEEKIISKIKECLSNKESLIRRIETYSSATEEIHDMEENVRRVVHLLQKLKTNTK